MAGEDVKDQQQYEDLEGNTANWQQKVAQETAGQNLTALEQRYEALFQIGEDLLKLIKKDKELNKEFSTLQKDITAAKGLLDKSLQDRVFSFTQKLMQKIDIADEDIAEVPKKLKYQLKREPANYSVKWVQDLPAYPDAYMVPGWDAGASFSVLQTVLTSSGFPDPATIREKTPADVQAEQRAAQEEQQQNQEHQEKANETAKTTIGDLDKQTNPYLVVSGTPEQLLQKMHEHPEKLTADERIKIIQYILVSKHFDKERADWLAALSTTDLDAGKFDKVRRSIKKRLRGGFAFDVRTDTKRTGKDVYRATVKKPFKKPEQSFDIGNTDEEPANIPVSDLIVPPDVQDAEINKALMTLPQVQARIALTLTEPYMGYFEVTDLYVRDMKPVALNAANLQVPASEWRNKFVAPNQSSPYALGYTNIINANENKLLSATGAVPKYGNMLTRLNAMGFPGFIEGDDAATEQVYSTYVRGIIERTGARFVLLGSKGQQPYDAFMSQVNNSMRPFGKNYIFPTFDEMRNRVIAQPSFLDLPRESSGTNNIKQQGEDLKEQAKGTMGAADQQHSADQQHPENGGVRNGQDAYGRNGRRQDNNVERVTGKDADLITYETYREENPEQVHDGPSGGRVEISNGTVDPRFQQPGVSTTGQREVGNNEQHDFVERVPPNTYTPDRPDNGSVTPGPEGEAPGGGERPDGEGTTPEHENTPFVSEINQVESEVTDFTKMSIEYKVSIASAMYLGTPEDYTKKLEEPFANGDYDHVVVVFHDFTRTKTDETVLATGNFGDQLEDNYLWQMKEQARGKKVGIYYIDTMHDGASTQMNTFLQRKMGIIKGSDKPKASGIATFSNKDLSMPSHQWARGLGEAMHGFEAWIKDPDASAPATGAGRENTGEARTEAGGADKKGWDAIDAEVPAPGTVIHTVPDEAAYAKMRESIAEGEYALTIWGSTTEPITNERLQQITSYYAKKGVKVFYVPNANDEGVWKTKFNAWIVTKANGQKAMFPESKIPADATKDHKVQLPFALIMKNEKGSVGGVRYPTEPRKNGENGFYAIKKAVTKLDGFLEKGGK